MGKILKLWPKEEIIKALQELPKDKPINYNTIIEYSKQGLICNYWSIGDKFGSLRNACEEANVRCDSKKYYNKQKLIQIFQDTHKKYGVMTPTEFILKINEDIKGDVRPSIKRLYGSWEKALLDAGIDYRNYHWSNERIINTLRELNNKYGPLYIIQLVDFQKRKLICGRKCISDRFGSIVNAARMAGFEFVEPQNVGNLHNGRIGLEETEILDNLEVQYGIKLSRQYPIMIDNKVYRVDGYDSTNNVCYEIDEKYHRGDKQKLLDRIRDEKITKHLNCQIIHIRNY